MDQAAEGSTVDAIEVFYSYSHGDEPLRKRLENHLSILLRQGVIAGWHDRMIGAGKDWKGEIDSRLESAQVILLLISPSFVASDYCYDVEMKRALKRHDSGQAKVIPVILRPVDWRGAPFGKLQALPRNARPVTSWRDRDEAFKNVAEGIRGAIDELRKRSLKGRSPGDPPAKKQRRAPNAGDSGREPGVGTARGTTEEEDSERLQSERSGGTWAGR